jgi:DNA primase
MTALAHLKATVDIISVIQDAGVNLRQVGNRWTASCPFHSEKAPSFYVFQDRQKFQCFGCQAHGDVVDFTMKIYGLSFREALGHLGIDQGAMTPAVREQIQANKRRRELVDCFRRWESKRAFEIADMLRVCRRLAGEIRDLESLDRGARHEPGNCYEEFNPS